MGAHRQRYRVGRRPAQRAGYRDRRRQFLRRGHRRCRRLDLTRRNPLDRCRDRCRLGLAGPDRGAERASLTLTAPRQTWNGPVRSGGGTSDGGPVALSGAITAGFVPVFSLMPDASFAFATGASDGTPSSYTSPLGLYVQTGASGAIALDAPVRAGRVELISKESVALGSHASLTGTGPGDAVVVAAGRGFVNAAGADALRTSDPAARWLLYADAFDGLTGAEPTRGALDLYGRSAMPRSAAALRPATPPAIPAMAAGWSCATRSRARPAAPGRSSSMPMATMPRPMTARSIATVSAGRASARSGSARRSTPRPG